MDELLEILEEIEPWIDYMNCDNLLDDSILDSFAILTLVSEIEDIFDVELSPSDVVPENFTTVTAIWDMITRLSNE